MKKTILTIAIALLIGLSACTESITNIVKKRIIQSIEVSGMGMLENLEIESIEKISDSTYKGVHTFFNPVFKTDVRVTNVYTFRNDSIINKESGAKTQMLSEGEWVNMKY